LPVNFNDRKGPKAALFEIARQFGKRVADDFTDERAFVVMQEEWHVLHEQQIVPQKPPRKRREATSAEAPLIHR
jgi:hypothetical protein